MNFGTLVTRLKKWFMKIVKLLLLVFTLSSCKGLKDVPYFDQMNQYPYGAQISISTNGYSFMKGELLAVTDSFVWLLRDKEDYSNLNPIYNSLNHFEKRGNNLYKIDRNAVRYYRIQVGRSNNYAPLVWASLLTIGHGWFSLLTLPANLIVTTIVKKGGKNAYSYDEFSVSLEQMHIYARYPGGIPEQINEEELLNSYPIPVKQQTFPSSTFYKFKSKSRNTRKLNRRKGVLE